MGFPAITICNGNPAQHPYLLYFFAISSGDAVRVAGSFRPHRHLHCPYPNSIFFRIVETIYINAELPLDIVVTALVCSG